MTTRQTNMASGSGVTRREVLRVGAAGAAALAAGGRTRAARGGAKKRPNFLFIITDQQGLDTLSAFGLKDIHTPNLDRLAGRGVSFLESHSTNPLCSPARSSMFTGRPTLETGVIINNRAIPETMPNMGQWLRREGYETIYTGKWHVPESYTVHIPGFEVIAGGINGQGGVCDAGVSRACQAYLRNRSAGDKPFLLVASFLQPHDVCQFVGMQGKSKEMPYIDLVADRLPPMPANHGFDSPEPKKVGRQRPDWNEQQWRYYIWNYYRMVEMVDAEIGRILDALDESGLADNTVVIFTSDHGEGRGRHGLVTKNYLYDEAVKVPLIVSAPGQATNVQDTTHLVSGVDILPTVCDFAGLKNPPKVRGRSLRPLLEGKSPAWSEFVAAEVQVTGRMIRTGQYKYITYEGDPVEQLFDMKADPGETTNLAPDAKHASTLKDHQKLLADWKGGLDILPVKLPTPEWQKSKGKKGGGKKGSKSS